MLLLLHSLAERLVRVFREMVNFTILAGGYTTFIGTYLFNSDAGTLSLLNTYPTGNDPSWITAHPTNSSII